MYYLVTSLLKADNKVKLMVTIGGGFLCMLLTTLVYGATAYTRSHHVKVMRSNSLVYWSPSHLRRGSQQLKLFPSSTYPYVNEAIVINGIGALMILNTQQKSLTPSGLFHATLLGIGLWSFLDFQGWLVCVGYLLLGSLVTAVKMKEKEKLGIAEKRGGARSSENVWGSAATAMVCALGSYCFPQHASLLKVGYVAAIGTKLSDTFGSEIGKAFGRSTYLITTMRMVPRGTEGAVSIEGTLAGVVGSILIAALAYALQVLPSIYSALCCIAAAFVATTIESYIGAVFQDKVSWLNNELVNLIMTVIGALLAMSFVRV